MTVNYTTNLALGQPVTGTGFTRTTITAGSGVSVTISTGSVWTVV